MRWEDLKERFLDFAHQFKREKEGIVGLGIIIMFVAIAILAPILAPPPSSDINWWHKSTNWDENPRGVPPAWIEFFTGKKMARHLILTPTPTEKVVGNLKIIAFKIEYNFDYDAPPTEIIIKTLIKIPPDINITYFPFLVVKVTRPDKRLDNTEIYRCEITLNSPKYIPLAQQQEIKSFFLFFARDCDPLATNLTINDMTSERVMYIMFSKAQEGMSDPTQAEPLKGIYTFEIVIYTPKESSLEYFKIIFAGRVYGLLGTDADGKDLFLGLVWGTWVALVIGLLTSVISSLIGLLYGVTSAYLGGKWDEVLQRINDFFYTLPVFPILLLLAAVWKPSIWNVIFLLAVFSWPGMAKVVRSMALQIKEQPFVEAAKASGASGGRIIVRHIAPQIMPYVFASIALGVPAAILTEAGLSFLGLGDPSLVTWGKILHEANAAAATIRGMWWWVIPPGLAIALMGLAFAFIGVAVDRILNPKMREIA